MRGLLLPSFIVALVLGAACASSLPSTPGTGGGSSASGAPLTSAGAGVSTLAGTGGGPRSCGVHSTNLACNSCIQADCCYFAHTCAGDPTCLECAAHGSPPPSCNGDAAYVSLMQCLTSRCTMCFGGSSAADTTTTTSADGSTSTTTGGGGSTVTSGGGGSTGSFGAGGSTGSFGAGGSTGSFGVGGSTGSFGAGGGTGSSGGAPTSCDGADWDVGCCDGSGEVWYCDSFGDLKKQTCSSGKVCGWNSWLGYYDCVSPPGGEDPDGIFPKACGP